MAGRLRRRLGLRLTPRRYGASDYDTVIVSATMNIGPSSPAMLEFLRQAEGGAAGRGALRRRLHPGRSRPSRRSSRDDARELQRRYPKIRVEEDRIFIEDRNVWTSAGMTAGVDLALALVEADLGVEIARSVAKSLVVYHRRAGGQSQFSALLELEPKSDRIQAVLTYAQRHLDTPLTVEQRTTRRGRAFEPPPVQPRLYCRNRPVSG